MQIRSLIVLAFVLWLILAGIVAGVGGLLISNCDEILFDIGQDVAQIEKGYTEGLRQ